MVDPLTGAVRSVQSAQLLLDRDALARMWTTAHLRRLARTYWRFISRVTLGLVRIRYDGERRSLVLLASPLRLLSFGAPDYELTADMAAVRWRIEGGLLLAGHGRGHGSLAIEVRRPAAPEPGPNPSPARVHVVVEVAGFHPAIAAWLGRRVYAVTQSPIHIAVTSGFLRSLARCRLASDPEPDGRVQAAGDGNDDLPPAHEASDATANAAARRSDG